MPSSVTSSTDRAPDSAREASAVAGRAVLALRVRDRQALTDQRVARHVLGAVQRPPALGPPGRLAGLGDGHRGHAGEDAERR